MNCTLCNMCMIEDPATGRVLVQHRLPKATNPWCGLTFPGGHVEAGESITASTIREIREETGLTVSNLRMCGVVEWETLGKRADGSPAGEGQPAPRIGRLRQTMLDQHAPRRRILDHAHVAERGVHWPFITFCFVSTSR